jgi:hypothetical protein
VTRICDVSLRAFETNALVSDSAGKKGYKKKERSTKRRLNLDDESYGCRPIESGRCRKAQTRRTKDMATAAVGRLKRKLPDRLATVRADRSQRQFARDLGVFQQNVNRYESGTTPHTDFLITLALKENISIDWLLLGKGKMRKSR